MSAAADAQAWRIASDGLSIRIRLTPGAAQNRVGGLVDTREGPAVQARVRAVPEHGKANTALVALVAEWLGVAKSAAEVSAGSKSRLKHVHVAGDGVALAARAAALIAAAPKR